MHRQVAMVQPTDPKIVNGARQSQTRARAESIVAQLLPALARRINSLAHRADVFDVGVTGAEPQTVIVAKDEDFAGSCS